MKRITSQFSVCAVAFAFVGGLAGCKAGADPNTGAVVVVPPVPTTLTAKSNYMPKADAGIPITALNNPKELRNLVAMQDYPSRQDPFSLLARERTFDMSQLAERLSAESGGLEMYYEPPAPPSTAQEVQEPQPYRRLSGVIVGDSVIALVETAGSSQAEIVRPGQLLPGTDWRIVSIDEDKAVLRREGNVEPKEIIVRLEQRPPGFGTNSGQGGFGPGGPGGPAGPGGPGFGPAGPGGPGGSGAPSLSGG